MFKFVPVTDEIIDQVVDNLHEDHLEELKTLAMGSAIKLQAKRTVNKSKESWACYANGELAGMFGIIEMSIISNTGAPWMMMTPVALKYKRQLLIKGAKIAVAHWMKQYDTLENVVPSAYGKGIKWIEMLGFTVTKYTANLSKIEMRK